MRNMYLVEEADLGTCRAFVCLETMTKLEPQSYSWNGSAYTPSRGNHHMMRLHHTVVSIHAATHCCENSIVQRGEILVSFALQMLLFFLHAYLNPRFRVCDA